MAHRIERVNNIIRREISELLQRQVKDPRLGNFVIVTMVTASSDLKYAKIFVNCVSSVGEKQKILNGLTAASGFLRNELARRLKLRRIPVLSFQWDDSIERGTHLTELIDQINTENTLDQNSL